MASLFIPKPHVIIVQRSFAALMCRVLGSREFALFYRQRHRAPDVRQSVAINTVLAKCVSSVVQLVMSENKLMRS